MEESQKTKINFNMGQEERPKDESYYHQKLMEVKDAIKSGDQEHALSIIDSCLGNSEESEEYESEGHSEDAGRLKIKFQ